MEMADLSHEQQVALVAMVEATVASDGMVSESEEVQIGRIAAGLGDDTYRQLLDEAESTFPALEDLKDFLQGMENQKARELIYGTVLQEAVSHPTIDHARSELLQWLASTWNIKVEIQPAE